MSKPAKLRAYELRPEPLKEDFTKAIALKNLKAGDVIIPPAGWFSAKAPYDTAGDGLILNDRTQDLEKLLEPGVEPQKAVKAIAALLSLRDKSARSLFGKECVVIDQPHQVSTPDINMFSNCGDFYSWHTRISPLDGKGAFSSAAKPIAISEGDGIYYHCLRARPTRALDAEGIPKKLTPSFV